MLFRSRIVRDGLRISIVGRPNVGKSSLLNLILNEERAIVTDIPGTIRDTIKEYATISGIPVILTDTAGIRETDDIIERIGIEKSRSAVASADIVILMLDSSQPLNIEDMDLLKGIDVSQSLILLNKSDITDENRIAVVKDNIERYFGDNIPEIINISATTGEGRNLLENSIKRRVYQGDTAPQHDELITNVRHIDLIRQSLDYLEEAVQMLDMGEALDFAETDIRSAWNLLGEITGDAVNDDIISEVFSRFCLGK